MYRLKPSGIVLAIACLLSLGSLHADVITENFEDWPHYFVPGTYTNSGWAIRCFRVEGSATFIPIDLKAGWFDRNSSDQWLRAPQRTNGVGTVTFWARVKGIGSNTSAVETAQSPDGPWTAQTNFTHTSQGWSEYDAHLNIYTNVCVRIRKTGGLSLVYMGIDNISMADPPADVVVSTPTNVPDTVYVDTPANLQCRVSTVGDATVSAVTSFWRVAGGPWKPIEMTNTAGTAYETACAIPGQTQPGARIDYYVSVWFSGTGGNSPRNSDPRSYVIAARALETEYENLSVEGDFAADMALIVDYQWQGVFSTNDGITGGQFGFSGRHTNTTTRTWGQTDRSSALPFAGTAAENDSSITVQGTYTGQFAFVFNEFTLDYTVRQAIYHDFTGWDSPTYAITSNSSWLACNAAIRNDGERRLRGNACYLSSNQLSFVQSAPSPDGIGEVNFWYRNHETNGLPATDCLIQLSNTGGTNDSEWATVAAISNVVATYYTHFTTNLNTRYARYVRILNQPEGEHAGLCLDEILVTYAGAGVVLTNVATSPAEPTTADEVRLSVDALPQLSPTNIEVTACYRIGTSGVYTAIGMTNAGGDRYVTTHPIPNVVGDEDTVQFYFATSFEGFESQFAAQPLLYPPNGDAQPLSYWAHSPVAFTNLILNPATPSILDEVRVALTIEPHAAITNVTSEIWFLGGTNGTYDSLPMVNTGNWTFVTQPDDLPRGVDEMKFYIRTRYASVASAQVGYSYYPADYETQPLSYTCTRPGYFSENFNAWPHYPSPGIYSNNDWIVSCFRVEGSATFIPHLLSGQSVWLDRWPDSINQWIRTPELTNGVGILGFWTRNVGSGDADFCVERSTDGQTSWTCLTNFMTSVLSWQEVRYPVWSDTPGYYRVRKTGDGPPLYCGLDTFGITRPPAGVSITDVKLHPGYPATNDEVYVTCRIKGWEGRFFPAINVGAQLHYQKQGDPGFTVVEMTRDGDTFTSAGQIPKYPTGTVVQYYIKAVFNGHSGLPRETLSPTFYPSGTPDRSPSATQFYTAPTGSPAAYVVSAHAATVGQTEAIVNGQSLAEMELVEDNVWQGVLDLAGATNRLAISFTTTDEYVEGIGISSETNVWGDATQGRLELPVGGTAQRNGPTIVVSGNCEGRILVRFNPLTGEYLVLRCAYTDFNDWPANPNYFEASYSHGHVTTVETDFENWPPDVAYTSRPEIDLEDFELWPATSTGYYSPASGYVGWLFEHGWDRSEITGNQFAQLRPTPDVGKVWALRSALTKGIDTLQFRYRSACDDHAHTVYDHGTNWLDHSVDARFAVGQVSPMWPYVSLKTRYQDENNYYEYRLGRLNETRLRVSLWKRRNGSYEQLADSGDFNMDFDGILQGETYTCKLITVTNNGSSVYLEGRVNDVPRVWAYDSLPTHTHRGTIGLRTREADLAVDNVKVQKLHVQRFGLWTAASYGNWTQAGWSMVSGKPHGDRVCHLNDNVNIYTFDGGAWPEDPTFATNNVYGWHYEDARITDDWGHYSWWNAVWLGEDNGALLRSSFQGAGATRVTFYCRNRNIGSISFVVETSPSGGDPWELEQTLTCTSQGSWQFKSVTLSETSGTYVRFRKTQSTPSGAYLGIDSIRIYREPFACIVSPAIGYTVGEIEVRARESEHVSPSGPASYDLQGSTNGLDDTWVTIGSKGDLYSTEQITTFTAGLGGYSHFRILNTSEDDRLRVHAIYIKAADADYSSSSSGDFNQSPARDWTAPDDHWYTGNGDYRRPAYVGPLVGLNVQMAPTNGASDFGPENPNSWSNVATFAVTGLTWHAMTFTAQQWDTSFIRIRHAGGDASLCLDDLALTEWRGRNHTNAGWTVTEGWIDKQMGVGITNTCIELTRSRANPKIPQALATPWTTNGIGEIRFDYRTENGPATLQIEKTSSIDTNVFMTNFPLAVESVNAPNWQTGQDAYRMLVRTNAGTPMRLRIRHTSANRDTRLFIDNVRATDYPVPDVHTWQVYNALITDQQDQREFEGKTCFLNNDPAADTAGEYFLDDLAYMQSSRLPRGIGRISFPYRSWQTDGDPPATIRILSSPSAELPRSNWTEICTISVTNTEYAVFETNIYDTTARFLRIYCETNPNPVRVGVDNILIAEPAAADFDIVNVRTRPEVPLYTDQVHVSADLVNKRLNPSNIVVRLAHCTGSNNWASWPATNWITMTNNGADTYTTTAAIPAQEIDQVVQYFVHATYEGPFVKMAGLSPKTAREFTNPPWYYPIDLNANQASTNPYYFVFSCPTGAVWINEFNYHYPDSLWSDPDNEFVEIAGKSGSVVSNWRVELVNGNGSPPLYNVYGEYPITNIQCLGFNTVNGYGFWVLGDPGVVSRDELLTNTTVAGAHIWPPSGGHGNGIRLVRSMGAWQHAICYGTSMIGHQYTATIEGGSFDPVSPIHATGPGTRPSDFTWTFANQAGLDTPAASNTNQTLVAYTATQTLTVASLFEGAIPPIGVHTGNRGDWFTCAITNSPVYAGVNETQYVCSGWTRTGNVPLSGPSPTNTGPFMILTDSSILWHWQTNLYLPLIVSGNGSMDAGNWVLQGSSVTITATPEPHHAFVRWSGDTNDCVIASNELSLLHVRPRYPITAHFDYIGRTLSVASAPGLTFPLPGLYIYDNGEEIACLITNRVFLHGTTQYVHTGWIASGSVPAMQSPGPEIDLSWYYTVAPETYEGRDGTGWLVALYADGGNYLRDTITTDGATTGDDVLVTTTTVAFSDWSRLYWNAVERQVNRGSKVYTVVFNGPSIDVATHYVALTNGSPFFIVETDDYSAGSAAAANWQQLAVPTDPNPGVSTGPFTITNDSAITWLWTTNYYLALHTNGNGSVGTGGWVEAGQDVRIVARPADTVRFAGWQGTVWDTQNPLDLVMLQPYSITGVFEQAFFSVMGTPYGWLQQYFPGNCDYQDTNDFDMDGSATWMEYVAGTVPTDAESVFRVIDVTENWGAIVVRFYATTNSGVTAPCSMYRTTNLLDASAWEIIERDTIWRHWSGVNEYWDWGAWPLDRPYFYRPAITWTNGP